LVKEEIEEFGSILLDSRVNGGSKRVQKFFGNIVKSLREEKIGKE
jgi:hypothetical protein